MSAPAICWGTTPSLDSTSPARPPIRIFRPLTSARLLISWRNQPPICVPVLPPGMPMTLYLAKNSFIRSMPPAWYIQAFCCRLFSPNGSAVPKAKVGSLPQ